LTDVTVNKQNVMSTFSC